ncbi:hypothetical protein TNCV_223681 [Trichonephila clavipes]|nr:hypothetical protein TNCV_223681 [Trichonephila clavipes]
MVKVMDSRPACHKYEPSSTVQTGLMHDKYVEAQTSRRWCGVFVRRGGCQLRCRRFLTLAQNDEVRHQQPSSVA